jgi:hypothetical protein
MRWWPWYMDTYVATAADGLESQTPVVTSPLGCLLSVWQAGLFTQVPHCKMKRTMVTGSQEVVVASPVSGWVFGRSSVLVICQTLCSMPSFCHLEPPSPLPVVQGLILLHFTDETWTQGLVQARQAFYHLNYIPQPFFALLIFQIRVLCFLPGPALDMIRLPSM